MNDAEWLDQVEELAVQFGGFDWGYPERKRVLPYLARTEFFDFLDARAHFKNVHTSVPYTLQITQAAREGIVSAITNQLTQ